MSLIVGKLLKLFNPGWGFCSHCGITWNFTDEKSLFYSNTTGYFPICLKCFNDPKVSYSELMEYYVNPHETSDRFSQDEKDYILNSLFLETKSNGIISEKYREYIILKRSSLIDRILSND